MKFFKTANERIIAIKDLSVTYGSSSSIHAYIRDGDEFYVGDIWIHEIADETQPDQKLIEHFGLL